MPDARKTTQPARRPRLRKTAAGKQVTAAKALQVAKAHLLRYTAFDVCDSRKKPVAFYAAEDDCWLVFPTTRKRFSVGSSRVIAVSKKTGKVVFDGDVGE